MDEIGANSPSRFYGRSKKIVKNGVTYNRRDDGIFQSAGGDTLQIAEALALIRENIAERSTTQESGYTGGGGGSGGGGATSDTDS